MIKHNLKLILRSLWTRRLYSSIILLSLTVGFVCSNILISFLVFEKSTDTFHTKHERIFQVFSNDPFGGEGLITFIPDAFSYYLTTNYAEVENVCRVSNVEGIFIEKSNDKYGDFVVLSVDSTFFTLFDFRLLHGRRDKCLEPGKIILSKDKALTLFGSADVVGNSITVTTPDTTRELIVSAVLDATIENSHLRYDVIAHNSTFSNHWGGSSLYALLKNANAGSLVEKLNNDPQCPGLVSQGKTKYSFNPLAQSHFNTDNKMMCHGLR